jgi:hypothetical protein
VAGKAKGNGAAARIEEASRTGGGGCWQWGRRWRHGNKEKSCNKFEVLLHIL